MRKTFDYWMVTQSQAQVDVEDIGNTCLRVLGGPIMNSGEYLLLIRTDDVGITRVLTYGPTRDEDDDLPVNDCVCSYRRFEYDSYKVGNIIKDFLRNTKANLAEEVPLEEYIDKIKNPLEYYENKH